MKKAFTLVELMISVILLSLIVTFLYQSVAQLQTSNLQFMKKTDGLEKRENLLKVLYNDLINVRSVTWLKKERNFDIISMQTNNSFHKMSYPYVVYKVLKEDSRLIRIESPTEKVDYINNKYAFNDIIDEVTSFKVYNNKGHYLIYLKAKGIEEVYLDIIPPSFLGENASPSINGDENNNTGNNNENES
ncbi:prepilin-type N-terminal cleavage/methylation domain-containing protein [Sulfurimonas sp. MAG313]|nr:prepilin-type N-terminal cleavage/methylation domain-containing protein [Sulfurimonas sp. MAG313]MDF1881905.1 prepilin-type N-terminal cleavage/methylation domain-containing protein [Sulfurimonas sp. MAG313]